MSQLYVTGATWERVAVRCNSAARAEIDERGAIHSHFCAQMSVWARRGRATRCNSCPGCTIGCVLAHMTQTLETTDTVTPQQRVDAWLADFEAAMAVRDVDRVVQKFATDSFWPDLVAFTWNIKTIEGRDEIADMLHARLAGTNPSAFTTRETPTQDGDV